MSATIARYFPAYSHPATGRLRHAHPCGATDRLVVWAGAAGGGVLRRPRERCRRPARRIAAHQRPDPGLRDRHRSGMAILWAASRQAASRSRWTAVPLTIQPSDFSLPPSANPARNVSIVFAMDYSPSTTGDARAAMEGAVVDFINSMSAGDYAAIVKFNDGNPAKASVVQPFTLIGASAAAKTAWSMRRCCPTPAATPTCTTASTSRSTISCRHRPASRCRPGPGQWS